MLRDAGIDTKLRNIDATPLNSGSIAQVHRAELAEDYVLSRKHVDSGTLAALLHDAGGVSPAMASGGDDVLIAKAGTPVVVKVMHPGVREQILADSAMLRVFGSIATFLIPGSTYLSLRHTVDEVTSLALSQLNLQREAENLLDFRFNFRPGLYDDCEGQVTFPKPLIAISSNDVLVETFEVGEPLTDGNAQHYASMGKVVMDMFMRMLFEHNLVHADLHPGNILFRMVNPDGSVALSGKAELGSRPQMVVLDPGLVTSLSDKERKSFISFIAAMAGGDGPGGAEVLYDIAPPPRASNIDMAGFERDLGAIFDTMAPNKIGTFSLRHISIGQKLAEVMDVMRQHSVRVEMNFATLFSSMLVSEGIGRMLEPEFNLFEHALPFLYKGLRSEELGLLAAKLQEAYLTLDLR
jgi:aarF domain-containing kinase